MNKRGFCESIAAKLRDNDITKTVPAERHTFRISDENGNTSKFIVKKSDRKVTFSTEDILAFTNAAMEVIEEALREGDKIVFHGFATLELKFRDARRQRHPATGEIIEIPPHYVPRFSFGDRLRTCARVYELNHEGDFDDKLKAKCDNNPDKLEDDEDDGID